MHPDSLKIAIEIAISLLFGVVGVRIGLLSLLYGFIALGCLLLTVLLSLGFLEPLAQMLKPWISVEVAKPVVLVGICAGILALGFKVARFFSAVFETLSEGADRSLGGGCAVAIGFLLAKLFIG